MFGVPILMWLSDTFTIEIPTQPRLVAAIRVSLGSDSIADKSEAYVKIVGG